MLSFFKKKTPLDPGAAPYSEKGTMWIQSRLNLIMVANSHDPESLNLLKVDGDYGRLTAGVVKDFQNFVGLPADGEAGACAGWKVAVGGYLRWDRDGHLCLARYDLRPGGARSGADPHW